MTQSSALLTCADSEKVNDFHKTQDACTHEKSENSTDGDLKIRKVEENIKKIENFQKIYQQYLIPP